MPGMSRRNQLIGAAVVALSAAVFWRTAYPTITWWDSSNYSTAASTLGLTAAPGSLLLTMLGWVVTRLPLGLSPAHALNLLAGLLAALTVGLVFAVAMRLVRRTSVGANDSGVATPAAVGAALGALTFAFSPTLWEHAVKFTPYVLTAVFTGLILWTMFRWWEEAERADAWRWLLLLGFLFGLDFSVHRTNSLLIPAAFAWVLIRHPRTLRMRQSWSNAIGGLFAGLAFHLLVIPIAANTESPLNMFDPSTLPRFWDYVRLENTGGNFLIDLWPRKSGFWTVQVADIVRVLGDNFAHWTTSVGVLGVLPLVAAAIGLAALWRRERRLAVAFAVALFLHVAATVVYFNIPDDYFRSLDRHYLPVCVAIGVLASYGLAIIAPEVRALASVRARVVAAVASLALLLTPASQFAANYSAQDAHDRYFTRDYAVNALEALPPNAIYYTAGDNDTFPVLYMQAVEGVRRDVTIMNIGLTNVDWYIERLRKTDPSFPLTMSAGERARRLGQPLGDAIRGDSIAIKPAPMYGDVVMVQDVVLTDLLRTNQWRRPLTFAITFGSLPEWLRPYARLEGLYWRIIPAAGVRTDPALLRANLFDRYAYRGFADSSTVIDDTSRMIGFQYYSALLTLLDTVQAGGSTLECRTVFDSFAKFVPIERLALPAEVSDRISRTCG